MNAPAVNVTLAARGELERMIAKALFRWKRGEINEHLVADVISSAIQREVLEAKADIIARLLELMRQFAKPGDLALAVLAGELEKLRPRKEGP